MVARCQTGMVDGAEQLGQRVFQGPSASQGLGAGLFLALVMMALQALGIWATQMSLGQELPFWTTILVMAALNLATIFPITPGNFGVYEATAFIIYKFSGLSPEMALSLAFLQHICFLVPMAGTGWVVLLIRSLNSIKEKDKEQDKQH